MHRTKGLVLESTMVVPNLYLLKLFAPEIAKKIQPGEFVMVMKDEKSERIPLSVAEWDKESLTMVFMEVGASTSKLKEMKPGEKVYTVVGPLGRRIEMKKWGKVLCVGGCYGIGAIFPIVKTLKEKKNNIITIIEARSSYLLYWEDKISQFSDTLIKVTRDGSAGVKGHIRGVIEEVIRKEKPQISFLIGCTFMMKLGVEVIGKYDIPPIVSLNSIMIDGTGMCGACRVRVGGKLRFVCVDGPHFDGREVDFEMLKKRREGYFPEEELSLYYFHK
jgi:ferredoxin--NADP+ reductase